MVDNREHPEQSTHKPVGKKLLTVTLYHRFLSAAVKVKKKYLTPFMHQFEPVEGSGRNDGDSKGH